MTNKYIPIAYMYLVGKLSIPARIGVITLIDPSDFYFYSITVFSVACGLLFVDPGFSLLRLSDTKQKSENIGREFMYFALLVLCKLIFLSYIFDLIVIASSTLILIVGMLVASTILIDVRVTLQRTEQVETFIKIEQIGLIFAMILSYVFAFLSMNNLAVILMLFSGLAPIIKVFYLPQLRFRNVLTLKNFQLVYQFCSGVVLNKLLILLRKNTDKWTVPFFFNQTDSGIIFFAIYLIETLRQQVNNIFSIKIESMYKYLSDDEMKKEFLYALRTQQIFMSAVIIAFVYLIHALLYFEVKLFSNWYASFRLVTILAVVPMIFSLTGVFANLLLLSGEHSIVNYNLTIFGVFGTVVFCIPGLMMKDKNTLLIGIITGALIQRIDLLHYMKKHFSLSNSELFNMTIIPLLTISLVIVYFFSRDNFYLLSILSSGSLITMVLWYFHSEKKA